MTWTTSSISSRLASASSRCWLVCFFAASPALCSHATSGAIDSGCEYSAPELIFAYNRASSTANASVLDAKEAVNSSAARLSELLVALKRDSEELQSAYGRVVCHSGNATALCGLMPDPFCSLAAECAENQRVLQSAVDKALTDCKNGLATSVDGGKRPPDATPTDCSLRLEALPLYLTTLGQCSAQCGFIVSNSTNLFADRFGDELSETYRSLRASVHRGLTEAGALINDMRSWLDYAAVWLQLVRPAACSAAQGPWSLPTGGQFLRVLLSRAFFPLTLLFASGELSFAEHLALSSFWIFVPFVAGLSAQKSSFVVLQFASYAPRLTSLISVLRFVYSLSLYSQGTDAALLVVSILCTALHSRHAFHGSSGGRAHTYRPFEWAFSVYINGVILTGFLGANLGEVATTGVIFMSLFVVSSANFVLQTASLKDYLQASVALNTLVSSAPVLIAFYFGLEEWLRVSHAVDFLAASSSFFWAIKALLPYVTRSASSIATGPSALLSWHEVAALVSAAQAEPVTRADRDLQTAILAASALVGGTVLFSVRLVSSYIIGRESLCRWEKRRGSRPVPLAATEAYADHVAYALLGLCPLFHRACPGLNFSALELIREMYSFNLRQSNAVMLSSALLSLALATTDFVTFLGLQLIAYAAYCSVVSYYGMAGAFLTSRGIDAELAQTSAAIDRLSVSAAEKEFLKSSSQIRYGSEAKRYCSAIPTSASPLASIMAACFDWEGVFGYDEDRQWDFDGLASGTLVSNGGRSAVITAEHCAISGPKQARLHGTPVHVPVVLNRAPPGLGSDPARACPVQSVGDLHSVQGSLPSRDPVVGEECLYVGARSLSWGKVASVKGMTAQTEQNPMPGYSGRLCVAASDFNVFGVVSMRTMWGEPRTGHISLFDVDSVNADAGFEVLRRPSDSLKATSLPASTSLANQEARMDRLCQEVSSQPLKASRPRRICQHHLTGTCKFGNDCNNVHLSRDDCLRVRKLLESSFGPEPYPDDVQPDDSDVEGEPEMEGVLGELIRDLLQELRSRGTQDRTSVALRTRACQAPVPSPPAEASPEVAPAEEPAVGALETEVASPAPVASLPKGWKKVKKKKAHWA